MDRDTILEVRNGMPLNRMVNRYDLLIRLLTTVGTSFRLLQPDEGRKVLKLWQEQAGWKCMA
jgi:hypothetical protein